VGLQGCGCRFDSNAAAAEQLGCVAAAAAAALAQPGGKNATPLSRLSVAQVQLLRSCAELAAGACK
jgi:hypothetical protein